MYPNHICLPFNLTIHFFMSPLYVSKPYMSPIYVSKPISLLETRFCNIIHINYTVGCQDGING